MGVLALQGSFAEHLAMLRRIDADPREIRLPEDLKGIDALIIPGGESTTVGKLMVSSGLLEPIREFAQSHPVWGTCAGMILLAREAGADQPLLRVMDIVVRRNAFGRQLESFRRPVPVAEIAAGDTHPFPAVFIRAPKLEHAGPGVKVIAKLADGSIVAARQGSLLATAFHPELSNDSRMHRYFLGFSEN